ncbi:MAG TPA: nucleoside-diphosphate sugar epimerase/dehydratase, partial [Chloroflexota bacterium]
RLWPRLFQGHRSSREFARVLIVGAGHGGQLVAADLLGNPQWHRHPVGFLDDDPHLSRKSIHGISVLGTIDDLPRIVPEFEVDIVAVAIPSASVHEVERILAIARDTDARIQILPSPAEVMMGDSSMRLRDINLDDLLDRVPDRAALERPEVQSTLRDKVILVTGARGSIGFELCRQLLSLTPARVVALDNNETGLFYLKRELSHDPNKALLSLVLGDVTDEHKMERIFRRYKPVVVFHAAAYKHVGMLEDHPEEAVFTNVIGTLNLCRAAARNECERFVFISTDKAVQPANVLGFSKRIGEFVVRAHQDTETVFCAVRFGNVVGSRGSALPEFIHQIDAGGPVKVTHPDVERYFMTIPEAVSLVIQAGAFARGGELFMLDMGEPIKIRDLAERIIRLRGLRVGKDVHLEYTGLQPGEKLSEEIMFDAERTQPTSNPAVFAVEDAEVPDLVYLEHSIAILAEVATQSDSLAIRSMLERLATDHFFRRSSHLKTVG